MSDTTTPADAADAIRGDYLAAKAGIEGDDRLSAEGKAEMLAVARDKANAAIEQVQAGAEAAVVAERTTLESRLLAAPPAPLGSTPGDRIAHGASYRDAVQRAAMTATSAELLDLQRRAQLTGDSLLARATVVVAFERADADVLNAWIAANPNDEADVERLWDMTHRPRSNRDLLAAAFTMAKV